MQDSTRRQRSVREQLRLFQLRDRGRPATVQPRERTQRVPDQGNAPHLYSALDAAS